MVKGQNLCFKNLLEIYSTCHLYLAHICYTFLFRIDIHVLAIKFEK